MFKKPVVLLMGLALSQLTLAAGIKPGLWEITTQTALPGGMVMPDLASLPPEARAMMAKHGVSMQGGAAGGMTARSCVTPQQAAKDEPPQSPDGRCRNTAFNKSGNTITWQMSCVEGGKTMNGKGTMTLASPESYSGNTTMTMNDPQHGSMTTTTQMRGRWLSAACQ